jgi:uncharacterized Zn-binding protein involved in type VI secretion
MINIHEDIEELLRKYSDPREGLEGSIEFAHKQEHGVCLPRVGVVTDNQDPLCQGRLRVACDMIVPGVLSGWIPFVSPGGSRWWRLPDTGAQVVLVFAWNNINMPIAIGCLYDQKHRAPACYAKNPAENAVWQTRNHRLDVIDEDGKESFILSSKKGQMRLMMTQEKGIELVNELGDISITCRDLRIEGKKEVGIQAQMLSGTSGEQLRTHSGKNIRMKCKKEVKLRGKLIKLDGSQGISTESKQLAAEGDKIMGFDIHQMLMPGTPPYVTPLPHPFIGKLADNLSNNVKINGHNAATKGSIAKHDDPVHNQLPGTMKFNKNPSKEGEVTNGTAKTVKINGKEAAVTGSTVTTCNDTGAKDNSVIMAIGASMPMPVIINPKNTEGYLREQEEGVSRRPEFTRLQWGKASVKEDEEIELAAHVRDIEDGNMVTFQIWREGQDPALHIAQDRIVGEIQGGSAKAKWRYHCPQEEAPPEEDPRYFFTAHSAWCGFQKSGNIQVKLKRPELSGPQWKNAGGAATDSGLVGEELTLCVSCNAEMEEGAGVLFRIYPEGADRLRDKPTAELAAVNQGGTARGMWTYRFAQEEEQPLKRKPKFFFVAGAQRCRDRESGTVEFSQNLEALVIDAKENPVQAMPYTIFLPGGTIEGETGGDGMIRQEGLIPGVYEIMINDREEANKND